MLTLAMVVMLVSMVLGASVHVLTQRAERLTLRAEIKRENMRRLVRLRLR